MMEMIHELLKKKRTLLIAILILFIVNVILYTVQCFYLTPQLNIVDQTYEELSRRSAAEGIKDVSTLYKHGIDDLKKISTLIPAKRQFSQLLGDLMDIASSNSLVVGKMSYKPQVLKEEDLLAYSLSMSVNGSYAAIKSFMSDLQSKHEMLIVDDAVFSNEDPYEESVSVDLQITLYLHNQEGA